MIEIKMITLALILITMLSIAESTSLHRYFRKGQTFCFSEDLPRHTFFRLSGKSDFIPIRIEIIHARDLMLNITTKNQGFLQQMTTQKFGMLRFCLTNLHYEGQRISFELVHGARANDFGTHAESGEYLKSLKNQADIAQKFVQQITEENKQGLEMLSQSMQYGGKYSIQYFFTTMFVGVIGICTYIQYRTIRHHMVTRKYI